MQFVGWNETCQKLLKVENTGNFFETFSVEIVDDSGMNFEISSQAIGLQGNIAQIPLNMTTLLDAEGLLPASARFQLNLKTAILSIRFPLHHRLHQESLDMENAASSVNSNRLEVLITMRNDGNTADGLVGEFFLLHRCGSSPSNAITEDGSTNIRSFEVVNIEKGSNFTFRAWAEILTTRIQRMNST